MQPHTLQREWIPVMVTISWNKTDAVWMKRKNNLDLKQKGTHDYALCIQGSYIDIKKN